MLHGTGNAAARPSSFRVPPSAFLPERWRVGGAGTLRDALITAAARTLDTLTRPAFRPPATLPPIRSILVLKPCCLGDVLMATAAIAQLRRHFADARIIAAVGSYAAPALWNNPRLSGLLEVPGLGAPGRAGRMAARRLLWLLRPDQYDLAVVLDRSPLMALLPALAGIPLRAGIDSAGRGLGLHYRARPEPGQHEAELYLSVIRALGLTIDAPRLEFFPTADDEAWADAALARARSPLLAIHPGGGVNPGMVLMAKRWPAERFGQLAARALDAGLTLVLVGSPAEQEAAAIVRAAVPDAGDRLVDLVGKTTIGQLGAVYRRCAVLVGNDTGPMHLAVAVGTPVVALFGPSRAEFYRPYDAHSVALCHRERCDGCTFRGGLVVRCRHNFACLQAVSVAEVWEETARRLPVRFR